MNISAFPKIYAVGKKEIENLFKGEVEITEKVDGSQFCFGVDEHGQIVMRSKGKQMYFESHDKMFVEAVAQVKELEPVLRAYKPGTYIYAEYLRVPKHNILIYGRVPRNHLIVFGVKEGGNFISEHSRLSSYAFELSLEAVPLLYRGKISEDENGLEFLKSLINDTPSNLGGRCCH